METGRSNQAYRPEIDGLRAIAVCAVIFYHGGLFGFSGGYVGVDMFFVISGYLITTIILREIERDSFTFAAFYERRIRRILPALFLVCFFSLILSWILLSPGQLKGFGQSLVATMMFSSNIYFFLTNDYFAPAVETLPLIHTWSLAVEEQFYVIFPVIVLLNYQRWNIGILSVVSVLFFASLVLCLFKEYSMPSENFYLAPFRAWELLAGSILALSPSVTGPARALKPGAMACGQWFGIILVAGSIGFLDSSTPFPGRFSIPPVLGTVLILACSRQGSIVYAILSSAPMAGIGLISYSAYLWHQPLFAFFHLYHGEPLALLHKILLVIATFILAWVSWRWVELPFRQRGRLSTRVIFTAAGTGSLFFVAFGLAAHLSSGFPGRFDRATLALAKSMEVGEMRATCHTDGLNYRKPQNACRYYGPRVEWAVFGDSHGIELGQALAERLKPQGQGIAHLTFSGCPPALTFESSNGGCSAWTREAVAWLSNDRAVKNVLLVYRHNYHLFGDQTRVYPALPDEHPRFLVELTKEQARARYWASFSVMVRRLAGSGKRVVIVAPVPELPMHAERYVFDDRKLDSQEAPSRQRHRLRSASVSANLVSLDAIPNVSVIYPENAICATSRCDVVRGGSVLYFDDNHLSMPGARAVIDYHTHAGIFSLGKSK